MKKSIFALLLTLCLVLFVVPANAQAAEIVASGSCGENLTWTLTDDGTFRISGTGPMQDYMPFCTPWNELRNEITKVVIDDGVTSIGRDAFDWCENLTTVTMPASVSRIGSSAFDYCTNLTSITMPNVTVIEFAAFWRCSALTDMVIPESVVRIDDAAFAYCESLTSIHIPAGATYVGGSAFQFCSGLNGIWVDEDNENYTSDRFGVLYNKSMTTLLAAPGKLRGAYEIPKSVTVIGGDGFAGCNELTSVTIPDGVTTIGACAFEGASALTQIDLPESVTSIGMYAFSESGLTQITLPKGITVIQSSTFNGCANLQSIQMPDSVTTIESWAFAHCTSLKNIDISASVTNIGEYVFAYCENLEKIKLPDGVSAVLDGTFNYCDNLQTVILPDSITSIGRQAFYACKNLTAIVIPDGVTSLGDSSFFGCSSLVNIAIPDSVATIGSNAFGDCTNLTSVDMPAKLPEIPDYLFNGCINLRDVEIPEDVTYIGRYAFNSCRNIKELTVPASVTHIADIAFGGCHGLESLRFEGNAPQMNNDALLYTPTTCYYPEGNSTWSANVRQNYGGEITWVSYVPPLKINTQPSTQNVKTGNTVKFSVSANGAGLAYQWQVSANGKTWSNCSVSSATEATLTFAAKTSHNKYYYRCVITDSNGDTVITNTVRLYVLGVTSQPKTRKVEVGEKIKFSVKATGYGVKYQWQYSSNGKSWKNCSGSTATKSDFTFTAKTKHDGNYYRCKITDSTGNVVYTSNVRAYALGVEGQPKTRKVEVGEKIKFSVKATGYGLKYQWQYSSNGKSWKNCSGSTATKSDFTFTAKTKHDGNYYRCKITDSAGNVVYTSKVRAYVLGVEDQPNSRTVTKGKTAKFDVDATGHGLKYQWQYSTNGGKTWKNCSSSAAKKATFAFTAKSTHNGNYYRCRITDSAGNVVYSAKAKLKVK